jgi:hypothetical protein
MAKNVQKLIIKESCIGADGEHLERGTEVECENSVAILLVGNGRALAVDSPAGEKFKEQLAAQTAAAAKVKPTK